MPSPATCDPIDRLLEAAILAPSSHNTQPWRFEVDGVRIALFADTSRALPQNDPQDRELTISCGAALFNLRVAAAHAGATTTVQLLPKGADDPLLTVVNLNDGPPIDERLARLYRAIESRRTYRKPFAIDAVPDLSLCELAAEAEREGAWLQVVSEPASRRRVAELVAAGDKAQWADGNWRRELAAWMHPRRDGDGLSVPGWLQPFARAFVRRIDLGARVGVRDRRCAVASPVLAALGTADDSRVAWLYAGQALQRLLLSACQMGLQASFLNQPIQIRSLRDRLAAELARGGRPQLLLRIGFPGELARATPRRGLASVVARRTPAADTVVEWPGARTH